MQELCVYEEVEKHWFVVLNLQSVSCDHKLEFTNSLVLSFPDFIVILQMRNCWSCNIYGRFLWKQYILFLILVVIWDPVILSNKVDKVERLSGGNLCFLQTVRELGPSLAAHIWYRVKSVSGSFYFSIWSTWAFLERSCPCSTWMRNLE